VSLSTLDMILAASMRASGTGVLCIGHGKSCGPGPGVLLMHRTEGEWELPAADDIDAADAVPFGDWLLARCDSQFTPKLTPEHDDFHWGHPEYAIGCAGTDPDAAAAIKQFVAAQRGLIFPGDKQMEDRSQFTAAQAKADRVAQMYGDSAPGPLNGEGLQDYRCRLARTFQSHSKQFKGADLSKIGDSHALGAIEDSIYADAMGALHDPSSYKPGQLRAIVSADASGRPITKYVGHAGACWDRFNAPIRHVTRIGAPGR
jgi:hypothetical protein